MDPVTPAGVTAWLREVSALMDQNRDYLIELDQVAGDGDLGVTMQAGFAAMAAQAPELEQNSCGKMLMRLGMLLNEAAPSSLGTILSVFFTAGGKAVKERESLDAAGLAGFVAAGVEGIMARAKSAPGERTILDTLKPAADALGSGGSLADGLEKALEAAQQGVEATKTMAPVHGRAVYHADKLTGVPDGGAVVGCLMVQAMRTAFAD